MSLVLPTWNPRRDNPNLPTLVEYFTGSTYTSQVHYRQYLHQSSTFQVVPILVEYITGSIYTSRVLYRQYIHQSSTLQVIYTLAEQYFTGSTYTSRVLFRQYLHQSSTLVMTRSMFFGMSHFKGSLESLILVIHLQFSDIN